MALVSSSSLAQSPLAEDYVNALLTGDRTIVRGMLDKALAAGNTAAALMNSLVWPTMEKVQLLYREDRISIAQLNLATRLNRQMTDQLGGKLVRKAANGKTALVFCGDAEPEELGGQIISDLFEADGWTVKFAGGGVPNDEVLRLIGDERPQLLVLFATLPSGIPGVRKLVDYLREVGGNPQMQILCAGGVYKRAEGLAEEIGADLYAPDAASAVQIVAEHSTRRATPDQQTVGRHRRTRKQQVA